MPVFQVLGSSCIWKILKYDWHGRSIMKMSHVDTGHEVGSDDEEPHRYLMHLDFILLLDGRH